MVKTELGGSWALERAIDELVIPGGIQRPHPLVVLAAPLLIWKQEPGGKNFPGWKGESSLGLKPGVGGGRESTVPALSSSGRLRLLPAELCGSAPRTWGGSRLIRGGGGGVLNMSGVLTRPTPFSARSLGSA